MSDDTQITFIVAIAFLAFIFLCGHFLGECDKRNEDSYRTCLLANHTPAECRHRSQQ